MILGWKDVERNRKKGVSAEDAIKRTQRWTRWLHERDERRKNSPRWQRMKKRNTISARDKIDSGRTKANPLWTDEAIAAHRELNKKRREAWARGERYQPEGDMRGKSVPGLHSGVTSFMHLVDPKKLEAYRNRRKRRWGHM